MVNSGCGVVECLREGGGRMLWKLEGCLWVGSVGF